MVFLVRRIGRWRPNQVGIRIKIHLTVVAGDFVKSVVLLDVPQGRIGRPVRALCRHRATQRNRNKHARSQSHPGTLGVLLLPTPENDFTKQQNLPNPMAMDGLPRTAPVEEEKAGHPGKCV